MTEQTNPPSDKPAPPIDESDFDDPRRPLLRALRFGSVALAVITIISLVVWGKISSAPGLWGVIIGAAIGGGFVLMTVISVLASSNTSAATTGVVVMGSWLLKIVVLLVVLFIIRDLDFYDPWALLITTIAVLIVVLGTEVWGVITSRVTYVS